MINYKILDAFGTTGGRLKEIFTAHMPAPEDVQPDEKQLKRIEKDIEIRKRLEKRIRDRLNEQILLSLKNYSMYSAADLAWDGPPINKAMYPLMLYAQGYLDVAKCAASIANLECASQYVTKDEKGAVTSVNLPKFLEVNVNLVRSVLTRRKAAQSNKYNALYPHYKYEARGTSLPDKLRADIVSQISDVISDGYGYKHHEGQVIGDVFKYAHCVDFPRCSWEKEQAYVEDAQAPELVGEPDGKQINVKTVLKKEGISWVNPHPTRVFWDNAYPLSSINTDTGCEFIGFWDVVRYSDIKDNPQYWNRESVSFSPGLFDLFTVNSLYFSQYYCTIRPASLNGLRSTRDAASDNDRSNNLALYSSSTPDSPAITANYFEKLIPKDDGIGSYPFPLWVRFVVGGDGGTVLFAEIMPSSPAAYCGLNEDDNRQVNISMAHELMGWQDQMTNLQSFLLMCIKNERHKVLVVDTDSMEPDQLQKFRAQAKGEAPYNETIVLEISRLKMREAGIDVDKVIKLVETNIGTAINVVFQTMAQMVSMVERLTAMSPQEQGQPAPREISATESNLIAGTTEAVYGFISDSIDEYRGAKKRILFESYMACGDQNLRVPVIGRYTRKTIKEAGFEVSPGEADGVDTLKAVRTTVIGSKSSLNYDLIFTSRDGAERSVNTQAANVLTQLIGFMQQNPAVLEKIGAEKLFELYNEVFRMSGAGVDLNIQMDDGEQDAFEENKITKIERILEAIQEILKKNVADVQQVQSAQQQQSMQPQPMAA